MADDARTTGAPNDPAWFRHVLGQFPTGVCAVTAAGEGEPIAMVVGSFTSVSLDPPLVAFLPAKTSSTWRRLRGSRHYCVNVLSSDQEELCRRIANKAPDPFAGLEISIGENGAPRLPGTLAAIECDLERIVDAGDHEIVLCRVSALQLGPGGAPLIFFRGGYGRFAAKSIVAADPIGAIGSQVRIAQHLRPVLEHGAVELGMSCLLTTRMDTEVVVLAEAEAEHSGGQPAVLIGQRLPYMPPTGSVFAAWADKAEQAAWLARMPDPERRPEMAGNLERVRALGASLGLISAPQRAFISDLRAASTQRSGPQRFESRVAQLVYDPDDRLENFWQLVRQISVPVPPLGGAMPIALTVYGWAPPAGASDILRLVEAARGLARQLAHRLEDQTPPPQR